MWSVCRIHACLLFGAAVAVPGSNVGALAAGLLFVKEVILCVYVCVRAKWKYESEKSAMLQINVSICVDNMHGQEVINGQWRVLRTHPEF